ncbi:T9SS type A sorting domain-containing protein [Taibaiella chishuiensis]|nr:T9SS type A sorting domain-containing protein [Taibaiella chishuiensis]
MKKQLFSITALLAVTIFSASAQEKRVPLFEMFTSSTCPPCNPGNAALDGTLGNKPATEFALVKFQQFFPGTGDPYTTAEGRDRFLNYYNPGATQIGVPEMHINGGAGINPNDPGVISDAKYNAAKNEAATYKLSGTYSIANKVVTANVKYTAISAGTAPVLYVAIVETKTIKNKKSNGETEFHNVMKKMMPSQTGTTLTEAVGVEGSKSLTFTFAGNYRLPTNGQPSSYINDATENSVEDFNNLRVVAWVQGSDKKVYQAANLAKTGGTGVNQVSNTVGAVEVYPNPTSGQIHINLNMKEQDEVSASIVSLTGAVVARQSQRLNAGKNTMSFDTRGLAAGLYNLIIFDSNNNSFAQRVSVIR